LIGSIAHLNILIGHGRAVDLSNLSGCFGEITAYRWWQYSNFKNSDPIARQFPVSGHSNINPVGLDSADTVEKLDK